MILRPYQHRAVTDLRAALTRSRAVVLALQVGGGKTVIACEVIRRALERNRTVLFLVHRVELVEQALERLAAFGIPAGVIKAGYQERRSQRVQVACVPTLIRREYPQADLVIIDEAHHAVSESWAKIVRHYSNSWILGITATPLRLDGKSLGHIFNEIVEPVTTADLIRDGYLIEPTVYAPPADFSGVRKRGGDYSIPELFERVSPLCGHLIDTWRETARSRPTLAFAVNVEHSLMLERAALNAGVRAMHIDGTSSKRARYLANAGLRDGSIELVTQCELWTEGMDMPSLECLIVARPTKSLSLHRQMIGRVMRPAPGKTDAVVLDHAGNHHEHGAITEHIAWSLDLEPDKDAPAPGISTCPECYCIVPAGTKECPECGAEITAESEPTPPGVDNPGELVEFNRTATMDEKRAWYTDRVRVASDCGYKLAWARFKYKEEFGVWPRFRALEKELYRCSGHETETKTYGPRVVERCARCYVEVG